MSWIKEKAHAELARIREAKEKQVYPYFKPFDSGGIKSTIFGKPVINFSSNDYLGLTNHPKVKEAAKAAVDRYACGLSSSRVQATTVAHVELEERLANYFKFPSCLITTTGYQAMVGTIMALADQDTEIILDQLSHACILDGTFLAAGIPRQNSTVRFFNHNSAKSLERCLSTKEKKNALVCLEGVYSLDGDQGKVKEILEVCKKYDACVVLDDAHGSGTLGKHGRGILEEHSLEGTFPTEKLVVVSTFSKTFGGIGGIILGDEEVVEHIKHKARSFVFSATLPVPIVAAASTILTMMEEDGPALVAELRDKSEYMRKNLKDAGFDLGMSDTHIMPVMCKEERKALFMHTALMENGVMMVPITYPGVKQGEERLRVNVTRGHSKEDLDKGLEMLKIYGEAFFVLSGEEIGEYVG